jgi:hypothetical protein
MEEPELFARAVDFLRDGKVALVMEEVCVLLDNFLARFGNHEPLSPRLTVLYDCGASDYMAIYSYAIRRASKHHQSTVTCYYVLDNFTYTSLHVASHPRVLLAFPYDRVPTSCTLNVCSEFPAREPVRWRGSGMRMPPLVRGRWYRFADEFPNPLYLEAEVREEWLRLESDRQEWRREKRQWRRRLPLPEELFVEIDSWLEGGFTNARLYWIPRDGTHPGIRL